MMASIDQGAIRGSAAAVRESFAASIPMKRHGMTDEVAALVAFLISDDAGYVGGGLTAA